MPLIPPNIDKLKARGDVERLIKLLRDKRQPVRLRAVWALRELADPRAREPLAELLENEDLLRQMAWPGVPGSELTVRWEVALGLAALDDVRAVEPLVELLRSGHLRDMGMKHADRQTRAALEEMTVPEAKRALADLDEEGREKERAEAEATEQRKGAAAAEQAVIERMLGREVSADSGEAVGEAGPEGPRLTHLLILLDGAPANEAELVAEILRNLKATDGRSYRSCVSPATRIAASVVGPMDFERKELLAVRAMMWWRTKWGEEPRLDDLRFARLSWPDLGGSTVEQWTTGEEEAVPAAEVGVEGVAAAAEWYRAEDPARHVRQVVVTLPPEAEVPARVQNLIVGDPGFNHANWAATVIFMSGREGPFVFAKAPAGIVEGLRGSRVDVAFAFYRLDAGGLFQVFVQVDSPRVREVAGQPFLAEHVRWPNDETETEEEVREVAEALVARQSLEVCFVAGGQLAGPFPGVFGLAAQLPSECLEVLRREWDDLLLFHREVEFPALRASLDQYNRENPMEASPILSPPGR